MGTALITRADMAAQMDVQQLEGLGKMLALSGYFERSGNMDQQVAQMCTKILAGREMGMGPFAAVQGIYLIKGKLSFAANLIASAIKASGRYDYKVRKIDDTGCEIDFFEKHGDKWELSGTSTFNVKDAERAGTQNMKAFPRNMMFARCMSNGQKWYAPDVFNGNTVYVPEELGANVDEDGNVIEVKATVVGKEVQQETTKAAAPAAMGTEGVANTHKANGSGRANGGSPAAVSPEWQTWQKADDMYEWAVEAGHYETHDQARVAFANMLSFKGLRYTKQTVQQVHQAWYEFHKQDADGYVEAEAIEDGEYKEVA